MPARSDRARQGGAREMNCLTCQGFGYYGGHIGGRYAGEWKWCTCDAAANRRIEEPDFVDVANKERAELIERIAKQKIKTRDGKMHHVTATIAALSNENYHGEW